MLATQRMSALAPGARRRVVGTAGVVAALLALLAGVEAAAVVADGHGLILACVLPLLLPIVFWRREETGVILLVVAAALIEQFPLHFGPDQLSDLTSTIPLFTSLSSGAGASGIAINPAELLIALVVTVWLLRAALAHDIRLPSSPFARALLVMLGIVAIGYVVGMARGGDQTAALIEVRPWVYLGVAFVLGSQLLRSRRSIDALLWALILCGGIKAAQTLYLLAMTRSLPAEPEALVGHEDSLFFAIDLLIVAGLWLYGIRGRLRATATALAPMFVLADLANHRRAAWVILGAGLCVMLAVGFAQFPQKRRAIAALVLGGAVVGMVYVPLFWNDQGTLGQPARAVRTLIDPSARDQGSDQYRTLEDQNLGIDVRASTPFGAGFGVPIDYAIPIVDISQTDSLIRYVPHDGVLYVWMRLGWQGMLAFWALVASAIFAALRLAAIKDARLAMLGVLTASTMVGYVILAYEDLGLFWYRVAIIIGVLLGAVEAARRLADERTAAPARDTRPGPAAAAAAPVAQASGA